MLNENGGGVLYVILVNIALLLLAIYIIKFAYKKIFQLVKKTWYGIRIPGLATSNIGFGNHWDVGLSRDAGALFLMHLFETREVDKRRIIGFERVDHRNIHMPPGGSAPNEQWHSQVDLLIRDEANYELHIGNPLDADNLCAALGSMGIPSSGYEVRKTGFM